MIGSMSATPNFMRFWSRFGVFSADLDTGVEVSIGDLMASPFVAASFLWKALGVDVLLGVKEVSMSDSRMTDFLFGLVIDGVVGASLDGVCSS